MADQLENVENFKNAGIYEMFMKSEIGPSEGMSRQLENNI